MGKKKIIIDTNNLMSALGWGGKSRILFQRVTKGEFELIVSIKQLVEIKRVLNYPKLKFTQDQINRFLAILSKCATFIETKLMLDVVRDKNDNMLLEAAIESESKYIITGDNDLLTLKEYNGIKIITVSDFLRNQNNNKTLNE